jgi:putative peptidoglycan lipid II flippase
MNKHNETDRIDTAFAEGQKDAAQQVDVQAAPDLHVSFEHRESESKPVDVQQTETGRTTIAPGVAQTAALMALFSLGTKVLGFLREVFLAGFFGTSPVTDAYVMAAAIPGILFAGVFTSMSVSYMPLYSDIVVRSGREAGNRFTSQAIALSAGLAVIGAALGIVFAEQLVAVFARGFDVETAALTVFYARITFSYIVFNAAAGLLESYLQYDGSFLRPIFAGYLQSGFVLVAIVVSAYFDYRLLAMGLLIGTALRTIALLWFALQRGFAWSPGGGLSDAAKTIVALAVPVFIGSTVNQINTFVDKMLASGLESGSVSALNYGFLLVNMITALTATVIVTIVYPRLTQAQSAGDDSAFDRACQAGFSVALIVSVPFALGAALYSEPVIRLVYERGAFDAASRGLTAGAFAFYSLGLAFVAVNALLVKIFYSLQDMKTPVAAGALAAATNIILNLLLIGPLAQRGLALATSIAALINTACLFALMRRRHPRIRVVESSAKAAKIVCAASASVGISYAVYTLPGIVARLHSAILLLLAVGTAALVYLFLLYKLDVEELDLLKKLVKR